MNVIEFVLDASSVLADGLIESSVVDVMSSSSSSHPVIPVSVAVAMMRLETQTK